MEVHSSSDWDLPSAISPSGTESRGSSMQSMACKEMRCGTLIYGGSPSSWSSNLGMLSSCRWICVSVWLGCGMVASARHRRHDHECRTSPGTTQPSGGPSVTLSLLRSSSLDGQSQTQHKFLTQTHPISPPKGSMQPDALFQLFGCIHSDSSCLGWEGTVLRKSHQHR